MREEAISRGQIYGFGASLLFQPHRGEENEMNKKKKKIHLRLREPKRNPKRMLWSGGLDVLLLGTGTVSLSRASEPSLLRTFCSRKSSRPPPDGNSNNKGNRAPTDWDKAWSNFRKQGKKSLFSQFKPDKYVSWNPRRSEYPLSEEVDPIKRTERSNLMLWTSPKFTLAGAIVVVSMLLIYTLLMPPK